MCFFLGGNGNKKTGIRPEYVDLIRLTSKMKKEARMRWCLLTGWKGEVVPGVGVFF